MRTCGRGNGSTRPLVAFRSERRVYPETSSRTRDGVSPLDARTRLFLWVLASETCFGVLFAVFGAITGAMRWREGRPAGTRLGLSVAGAFDRIRGKDHTPTIQGALTGGADGAVFGLVVGTVVGFVVGWRSQTEWELLRPILIVTAAELTCASA